MRIEDQKKKKDKDRGRKEKESGADATVTSAIAGMYSHIARPHLHSSAAGM